MTLIILPLTKTGLQREALTSPSFPTLPTKLSPEIEPSSLLRALLSTSSPETTATAPRALPCPPGCTVASEILILELKPEKSANKAKA